ncbi:MAG: discoidin domain-containing protein [Burkholderiales bacterium]|nr:MAG: discoidin domain-containing protein [Burkholderiales bacterium]
MMLNRSSLLLPLTRLLAVALFIQSSCVLAQPQDGALPPRSEWTASSSSKQVKERGPQSLIDGDPATSWGGAYSANHWWQVDMGRVAEIGGIRIHWDLAFATGYIVQTSVDGKAWKDVYTMEDSIGDIESVFFAPVPARFVRVASLPKTADWGVSVFEFEPLAAKDAARIEGLGNTAAPVVLWETGAPVPLPGKGEGQGTRELRIELPRAFETAGLVVDWGSPLAGATLESRDASGQWSSMAEDPGVTGGSSYLAASAARTVSGLRLVVKQAGDVVPSVKRVRLLGPKSVMTPMKRYEIAATREHGALFPASTHMKQIYWTVVGVHGGKQKSIFDEYGNIEAFKGAPLVQAIWRDASGKAVAADGNPLRYSLRDGWMPMPAVEWTAQPGLEIRSESFAIEQDGQPVTLVRHRLRNGGSQPVQGVLSLVVRPIQMNPPWQNGGLSPIREIALEGPLADTAVRVNGRLLMTSLSRVDARGAAPFGKYGETEVTANAAAGTAPVAQVAQDADGMAGALLGYRVALAPGAQRDVVVAFPLGKVGMDRDAKRLPDAPALDRKALVGPSGDEGKGFDALSEQVAQLWKSRFGAVGIRLPDESLVDMLRAQGAYMLINQTGHAIQPGPRNYDRSFIRDGQATAAILLRMGQAEVARDYLRWYAAHAVRANGLVSPIINDDGSNNTGFGSDIEYDSQGQFVSLVADIARLDGGAATVRQYQPEVKRALQFTQALRERTMVPGYMADREAPERFHGIIAPSISHEGYNAPTHSYWDDYWALKGWHDGAWLAEQWGDTETAAWAREQYAALRGSMAASILATMKWKGADFIPAAADLGDGDPTSVSIALDPTGQQDLLPPDALRTTFERYLADVRSQNKPGALYAYSPYELRNVLTYVHLNQPEVANELLGKMFKDRRPPEWHVFAEVVHSRMRYPRYMGDMPHTWIGAEYARTIYGMLMREEDGALLLLPGAPPAWLAGEGLGIEQLPTAYGPLSLTARQTGNTLEIELGQGLRKDTALHVSWPSRIRPQRVTVDGRPWQDFDVNGIALPRAFKRLEAEW